MADKNGTFEGDKIKPLVFVKGTSGSVANSDSKVVATNVHLAPSGVVVGEIKTGQRTRS
jgi:hypothetical protein